MKEETITVYLCLISKFFDSPFCNISQVQTVGLLYVADTFLFVFNKLSLIAVA